MSQEKLNGLAMLSIVREIASHLGYNNLMSEFTAGKPKKVNLRK
jgi:hypothetical protein